MQPRTLYSASHTTSARRHSDAATSPRSNEHVRNYKPTGKCLPRGASCPRLSACCVHCREAAIQKFNAPNSECFIFLLSIRAAGRGLNLQSSDTVVIYDPDPNPKNEEQVSEAQCRRILMVAHAPVTSRCAV